ncbi:MAG: nucleotide exchange factor GrpE [Candidatus Pacebacteria bacterium]|nr:nucleotide exchange factor GrpE [Candidatus Paceibacterota bacterium]
MDNKKSSKASLKPGLYRHYKGGVYQFLYLAQDKLEDQIQVVYKDRDQENYYVRSLDNFLGKVKQGKELKPRFEFLSELPVDSWESRYKRALADYQNLIRESAKEKETYYKYALEGFIQELLPVYDNLKISIASLSYKEASNPWVEGIKYVIKQFEQVLNSQGVEEISTLDKPFDPELMEAVEDPDRKKEKTTQVQEDKFKSNNENSLPLVKKQITPGYRLKGKTIRPARVVVE